MAIVPAIPGLVVTVDVAGEALSEYDYVEANIDNAALPYVVSRCIEAPTGAEFAIRSLYKPPHSLHSIVQMDIMLDDNYIQVPFEEWGGKDECEGYRYGKATFITDGHSETRNFRFAAHATEKNDQLVTEDVKRQIYSIGQLALFCYYIEGLNEIKLEQVTLVESEEPAPLSQKAVKAAITPGDWLSCRTILSTSEVRDTITFNQVKIANEPFAKFIFYYRSTAALKSLGIIARTPTPSPEPEPQARDPSDMSPEELVAEVNRLRASTGPNEQQQQLARVKREREKSVTTIVGDSDDDIEWVGTQPAKKARRSPGVEDEVVKLDD
ncbi:hypothetical protein EK21DRAFT_104199 [Setomelanomma holmii]|uniref:DUF7918 domain-containing protein n=1 Tax=Setomelanomma holmii TaxID=210430 RepID=A0A9P4H011_9PLEO|nr:hypothetical protein EK21DRAFT_104199 [Setomelanomma holmii]